MKPRERIYKALEFEKTDIIPYWDFFTSFEAESLFLGEKYLNADDVSKNIFIARLFNSDIINVPIVSGPNNGIFIETLYSDNYYAITKVPFGGIFYYRKKPHFIKTLIPSIRYKEDLDKIKEIEIEQFMPKINSLKEKVKKYHELGYFVISEVKDPFAATWMFLRDLDIFLIDIMKDEAFAKKLIEIAFKPLIEFSEVVIEETNVDAIWITGDLAYKERLFFNPIKYRELFKPWEEEIVKRVHKKGAKALRHSHGNIMQLFNDIIDVGYNWIDPLDPNDNINLLEVKEKYGDKITLVGGITRDIGRMTKNDLYKHITEVVKTLGSEGFILRSAGGVPPEMSLENFNYYREIIEKIRCSY
jgi:uroporphyrinogen-III decarboxylase